MARKTSVSGLRASVLSALNEYSGYVTAETKKVIKKAGKEAAQELRKKSPRETGEYAESWTTETKETSNTIHTTVYAGDHQYSLTHLLENGHAKRGGGRVAAIRHIEPPFMVWYLTESANFFADGKVYERIDHLNLELYTDQKDFELEEQLERILEEGGIGWNKTETYLDDEQMYEVLYEMEV